VILLFTTVLVVNSERKVSSSVNQPPNSYPVSVGVSREDTVSPSATVEDETADPSLESYVTV
jgi:hypothetical protein